MKLEPFENSVFNFKELTAVLRSMGQNPTDSQVHDMINEVEFPAFSRCTYQKISISHSKAFFGQVDVDGSGLIEFHEFVKFIVRNYFLFSTKS